MAMYPIATVTTQASCVGTFFNIPQTYKHLQVRVFVHDSGASSPADIGLRFSTNTTIDTGNNYNWHRFYTNGAGTSYADYAVNSSFISTAYCPGSGISSLIMGSAIIDVLDYTNTGKYKVIQGFGGYDAISSGFVNYHSGVWKNTSAINSLQVFGGSGGNSAYNTFQLYGIDTSILTGA